MIRNNALFLLSVLFFMTSDAFSMQKNDMKHNQQKKSCQIPKSEINSLSGDRTVLMKSTKSPAVQRPAIVVQKGNKSHDTKGLLREMAKNIRNSYWQNGMAVKKFTRILNHVDTEGMKKLDLERFEFDGNADELTLTEKAAMEGTKSYIELLFKKGCNPCAQAKDGRDLIAFTKNPNNATAKAIIVAQASQVLMNLWNSDSSQKNCTIK